MGMKPIQADVHPMLFMGSEIRRFRREFEGRQKVKLAPNEQYCFKCKKATVGVGVSEVIEQAKIGKGAQVAHYEGVCSVCGTTVRKYFTKQNILAEGKGINIDPKPPLYRSLTSGEELYGN